MPQTIILFCDIFDVKAYEYGFYGTLFPNSFGFSYILLAVEYVSKWVEEKASQNDDAKIVVDFEFSRPW